MQSKKSHSTTTLLVSAFVVSNLQAQPSEQLTSQSLPTVTVTGSRAASADPSIFKNPIGVGEVSVIQSSDIEAQPAARIEDLLQSSGLATASASSSFGLAPSLVMRGFSLNAQSGPPALFTTKLLVNGHADVANGFTRDMSTVERIEVAGGFDATLTGAGAPGGTVHYQTKRPQGKETASLNTTLATDGLRRLTFDTERKISDLHVRFVAATQTGQKTVEGLETNRHNLLVTSSWFTPLGTMRFDAEYQSNHAPFVFGTFYSGGKFWYDQPYVSPQSSANRQYSRSAFYFDRSLNAHTLIKAYWQQSYVRRKETLVGFWDIKDDTTLNGYYRIRDSGYRQQDFGLSFDHQTSLLGIPHNLTLLVQQQTQALDFDGPQSISEYTISIPNPIWPIDLTSLTLKPRKLKERLTDRGFAFADTIDVTDKFQVRFGTRVSTVRINTASNTTIEKQTADMRHSTHAEGFSWQMSDENKLWLSRSESFEPVRGQTRTGSYLPPQVATQYELGIKRQTNSYQFTANLFDIRQSNLPAADPLDRNYLIPLGRAKAQGITVAHTTDWLGLQFQSNFTVQSAKIIAPISSNQGLILAGVPRTFGAIKVSSKEKQSGFEGWVNAVFSGKKSATDQGDVYAPGYVRWDTGLVYKQPSWHISCAIHNLFDLRYVQALSATDNVWQGARRSLQVSATYQF